MDQKFASHVRVLLVDDDEDDCVLITRLFNKMAGEPFEFECISDSDEAIETIREARHDVYLIDYRLGAITGLEILDEVDAFDRPEPFIILTGVGDREVELKSIRLAASDYLVKQSLDSDMLARTLYYALGRKQIERSKIEQIMELNRSKDEFISIASHQLRTPATAVKQYVGMLLDGLVGELQPKQKEMLEKANRSNERQLNIVNDLLKVAQIDASGIEIATRKGDISELIQSAVSDMQTLYTERKQTLSYTPGGSVTLQIDQSTMRMVIDNLLENASKYSHEHSTVSVVLREGRRTIAIEVRDTGVGVSNPEKLFQKFSRIENALSTQVGGTGLGLYWARQVARLHGGELHHAPNTPRGSVFTLTLPRSS